MAEPINSSSYTPRIALVTGANKGIRHDICRQLAAHGITVILTARNEKRGLDALERLKGSEFFDNLVFHQLDVVDPNSVASAVEFIKKHVGRLDILVNNAGIAGAIIDADALRASGYGSDGVAVDNYLQ